ncbi:hypothetical protein ACWEJP_20935 [Streptomyces sp. NPDC004749]
MEAWTDDELVARVTALADSLSTFLVSEQDIQINVSWGQSASETVMRDQRTIP